MTSVVKTVEGLPAFEIDVEYDSGFRLDLAGPKPVVPEPWRGLRIRYRPLGSRGRWSKFLLDLDGDRQPSVDELQEVCRLHAERSMTS